MEVKNITEQEDGSGLVEVEMSAEEIKALLQLAFTIGLTDGLQLVAEKKLNDLESKIDLGNTRCGNPHCLYGPREQSEQSGEHEDSFEIAKILGGK